MHQRKASQLPASVPWSYPWYGPWRAAGQAVEQRVAGGLTPWDALNQTGMAPVRFVPSSELPPGAAYEQFIADTGTCPTRAGLHDLFNGLCWIKFPATKKKLNQLQAGQIALDGVRPARGALRDALTLFDENAAFLQAPQPLWDALVAKQWQLLFLQLRPLWRDAQLMLFGHALLEKLQQPRKPITAHVYRVAPEPNSIADMDAWIAGDLNAGKLASKPFAHLPILGVPGWWPDNEKPGFYEDSTVFRRPQLGVCQ